MITLRSICKRFTARALISGALVGVWTATGAAIPIPNVPLFLGNDVPANIFFALDDSGSMDWEVLLRPAALAAHRVPGVYTPPNAGNLDLTPSNASTGFGFPDNAEDLELCVGYNVMAYNPDVTYDRWIGLDSNNNAYQNQNINAALNDPYYPSSGTRSLTNIDGSGYPTLYGVWTDNDGDGDYDIGECPVGASPHNNWGTRVANGDFNDPRFVFVNTLTPAQQVNFANWYSYFRKREYVLKRAVSELVTNSQRRMGLATLHNNNSVGTPVDYMTNPAAKSNLLRQLFRINSSGGTPLRQTLQAVGHYFDQSDSGNALHSRLGFGNSSPILAQGQGGECQQNFTLLFSDGFWNGDPPTVGNTDSDGAGPWDGGPSADAVSNTLADVAMDFYERDLAPGITNTVPVIEGIDENNAQHMVTYTVSFGIDGTLNSSPPNHDPATPAPPWPTPVADQITTTDDMRHAAFNSRGRFLPGQDPQQLIQTLNAAFADIGSRLGTAAAVSATSQALRTGTLIFSGVFDTENWNGKLFAQRFLSGGIVGATVWEASGLIPAAASRNLFTWVGSGGTNGAEFQWANLTAALQADIGSEPILNYIRGDRSLELAQGGPYRTRTTLLGDIIDSTPVAVTKDQSPRPYDRLPGVEGTSFLAYQASKQMRLDMVYVGANDGILHGFRTDSGVEVMGYIPQIVFPNLARLADVNYEHRYYVDGGLFAGDAYLGGSWKSVLLGSTGRGGPAVFALNISNPGAFNANNVLWEYTHAELGIYVQKPLIARMNNNKWVAIFGNGFNGASETAQLFIIDLESGNLIKRIDTGVGGPGNSNGLNGPLLIDPNIDTNVDIIYAGDLLGNVWKFDVSDSNPNNWGIASFSNDGGTPRPLYRAYGPDGNPQSITTTPTLAVHPQGGYLVLFGTGRFLINGDDMLPVPPTVDTFYGIRDNGAAILSSVGVRPLPGGAQPTGLLQPQQILLEDTQDFDGNTQPVAVLSGNPVNYTPGPGQQFGWYLDLVSPATGPIGERVIADPIVLGGLVVFTTFASITDCALGGLSSGLFAIDAVTGGRSQFTVFDLNLDDSFDAGDDTALGDGTSAVVSMLRTGSTVAPVTLVASEDGNVVFGLTTDLNSGSGGLVDEDEDGDDEIDADDPNVYRLRPPQDSIGRQSWRQLR